MEIVVHSKNILFNKSFKYNVLLRPVTQLYGQV